MTTPPAHIVSICTKELMKLLYLSLPQHFLYFFGFPVEGSIDPQGQGSLRPTLSALMTVVFFAACR
jgi:hypothetical protein